MFYKTASFLFVKDRKTWLSFIVISTVVAMFVSVSFFLIVVVSVRSGRIFKTKKCVTFCRYQS